MKPSTRNNLIFVLVLAAVLGLLWLVVRGGPHTRGRWALVQYGDGAEQRIPLDRDARYDIDTGPYTIHLEVADGGIRFVDSPCPDHLCEGFGTLTDTGDWAACLPARASVTIVDQ